MTALHIPEGCGIATLKWTFAGKTNPVSTSLGYQVTLGDTGPADVADSLYDFLVTDPTVPCHASNMLAQWQFEGIDCIQRTDGVLVGAASSGPPVAGTKSSATSRMIMNTSLVIKKRTGLIGHKYRGRCYWPTTAFTEAGIDALGMIDPTELIAWQALVDAFTGDVTGGGTYQLVLLHTDPAIPYTVISSLTTESQVGTQRRRLR